MNKKRLLTMLLAVSVTTALHAAGSKGAAKILTDMYRTNLMEIEMGKLAKDKAESDGIRDYGDKLITDHQVSNEQVMKLAEQLEIKLPDEDTLMAGADHQKMQKLKNMEATYFDSAFAKMMVEDHKKAITRLEAAQKQSTEATPLITQTLPVLREHQQIAEKLVTDLGKRRPS